MFEGSMPTIEEIESTLKVLEEEKNGWWTQNLSDSSKKKIEDANNVCIAVLSKVLDAAQLGINAFDVVDETMSCYERKVIRYAFIPIKKQGLHICVGLQEGEEPIVYARNVAEEYDIMYCYKTMRIEQAEEIFEAVKAGNKKLAGKLFEEYFDPEKVKIICNESMDYRPISDAVPDDWFDEVDDVLMILGDEKMLGIVSFERITCQGSLVSDEIIENE